MKRSTILIRNTAILAIFLFSGCGDRLDLEPLDFVSPEVALGNDQGVKTALIGAYDHLSGFWSWIGVLPELYSASGDIVFTGSAPGPKEILQKEISTQNGYVYGEWANCYRAINQCNAILESIGNVDEDDQAQIEAEARFIRAASYFELINSFGRTWVDGDPDQNLGVPLVTASTKSLENLEAPRVTVSEVYEGIVNDLEFARNNLPEINGPRATIYAASALLSRVYLQQEDYAAAETAATDVIESGRFLLLEDYAEVFNRSGNTKEDIFTIEVTAQDGFNSYIDFYAGVNAGGSGQIAINDSHMERYDTSDQRAQLFYFDNLGVRRTGKWRDNESMDGNINIIRLAEMYLTRAECRFRDNDLPGALEDINEVRSRAGAPLFEEANLSLEDILNERYLELCFEGHLLRDIKRTKRNIGDISFDDPRMVFPIPQREMDLNGMLVQNPGY